MPLPLFRFYFIPSRIQSFPLVLLILPHFSNSTNILVFPFSHFLSFAIRLLNFSPILMFFSHFSSLNLPKTPSFLSSTNILGLVVFAVVTGIAIAQCGEDGKPLLKFFESISIVMMKVIKMI